MTNSISKFSIFSKDFDAQYLDEYTCEYTEDAKSINPEYRIKDIKVDDVWFSRVSSGTTSDFTIIHRLENKDGKIAIFTPSKKTLVFVG